MTQKSYYQNGVVTGDASLAPYDCSEQITIFDGIFGGGENGIIYGDGNVTSTNPMVVTKSSTTQISIAAGSAFIDGHYVYETSTSTLTVARTCSRDSWARVVVYINGVTKSATYAILYGTDIQNPPVVPEFLVEDNWVGCIPLAKIYIPATGDIVNSEYIFDERVFIMTPAHARTYYTDNIFQNSELTSPLGTGSAGYTMINLPARWHETGTPTEYTTDRYYGNFPNYERCVPVVITTIDALTITTGINKIAGSYSRMATTQFYVHVEYGTLEIYDGADLIGQIEPTAEPLLFIYRYSYNSGTKGDLELVFTVNDSARYVIGQITTTHGMIAASFRPYKEYVAFSSPLEIYRASLSAGSVVTVSTDLRGEIPFEIGVLNTEFYDLSSAAGTTESVCAILNAYGNPVIYNEVNQLPNGVFRSQQGLIHFSGDDDFSLDLDSKGTAYYEINILGVYT